MSAGGKKCVAYTQNEKLLLASLVDKHKNIVENKKTDASTIQQKQQEWDTIAAEYNSQAHLINIKRNATQLKKLWNKLKQRKRKASTELKYNRLLTGGGSEPVVVVDPVMEAVDVAAPHADISLLCPWDSTAVFEKQRVENYSKLTTKSDGLVVVTGQSIEIENDTTGDLLSPSSSGSGSANEKASNVKLLSPTIKGKKTMSAVVQSESNLRAEKISDAIKQQAELHKIRMKVENEQLQIALASRKKVEAESQLAMLQLQLFKEQNNL